MDTPTESAPLNEFQAAEVLSSFFEEPKEQETKVDTEIESTPEPEAVKEAEEVEEPTKVVVKVDGKDIELTQDQIAEAYKGQLRQSDYTKKTMEVAEQRKAAEAERAQAMAQRNQYASALAQQETVLRAALQEQNQVDWNALLNSDPVEFLKQKHLFEQRQAALNQTIQQGNLVRQQQQAEQQEHLSRFVREQHDELIAKLPEWKDESKAKAEKSALRDYLKASGYSDSDVDSVSDHKAVLMARKAMLYDQMVKKAQATAKKVENLPKRVERPTQGETQKGLDKRSAAFQRLSKTGRAEDAASLFADFL